MQGKTRNVFFYSKGMHYFIGKETRTKKKQIVAARETKKTSCMEM